MARRWLVLSLCAVAQAQAPLSITLQDALNRARQYNPEYQSAVIATSLAREDRLQVRATRYPATSYLNQYIYTQGNGTPSGTFVANDGVHVYNSQAQVHEDLYSPARRNLYRQAVAAEAVAGARQEIAARGLVAAVVHGYYGLVTARRKQTNAQRSLEEAQRFVDITRKQEQGGEVARADVVKAQLDLEQRRRDLSEAQLALETARLNLAVLIFPDFNQNFTVADDLGTVPPLASFSEVQALAAQRNPDIRAAQANVQQSNAGVSLARSAYLPTLSLDYFFGIDANQFAIYGPGTRRNLGSVAQATLNIPVWNWGATQSKVRQAELRRHQAQVELSAAQRQLLANLHAFYNESQVARAQLDSLRGSVDLAEESLRLTLLRYQAGEATALEVVDAQSTLAQARNAYDDGLVRYRVALAELQTLTGSL